MRTKAEVVAAIEANGGHAYVQELLRDLKNQLINRRYAKMWPLIESE